MNIFMAYILPALFLLAGFLMLINGANLFVDSSSSIAKKAGVSQLFIALTIVAMGTSIPETAVSLLAAIKGNSDLSVGNIVGTNTLNILLILGIAAIIMPMTAGKSTIRFEIPIMIVTAVVFPVLGFGLNLFAKKVIPDGLFSRIDGVIFLVLFGLYVVYLAVLAKKSKKENALMVVEKSVSWFELIVLLVAGLALIIIGSTLTVEGATNLASALGVSERIIGLTIVALGTSLPELATSITAAIKHQDDLAIGNIVGSNIYNMLFIGGVTALVCPVNYSAALRVDSLICIAASLLLLLLLLVNRKRTLSRFSGIFMLALYGVYVWYLLR